MKDENNYFKALDLFVGTDLLRPGMLRPFTQGGFAIATDAHALILIDKDLVGVAFEGHEKSPNALGIVPVGKDLDVQFETVKMREKINELKKLSKETYSIEKGKCPDCDGSGYVEYEFMDHKYRTHKVDHECPTCDDDGDWDIITNKKTGSRIEHFNELFRIKGALFAVEYVYRLVKTAELLSVPTFKLIHRDHTKAPHKFQVGESVVLLMPCIEASDNDLVIDVA